MARRQKQPHEGDIWTRTSDNARVRVISVRARSVSYENMDTDRRGSSALLGFLQRFQPKARRANLPINVININSARSKGTAPPVRKAANGGGFMTPGRPGRQIG